MYICRASTGSIINGFVASLPFLSCCPQTEHTYCNGFVNFFIIIEQYIYVLYVHIYMYICSAPTGVNYKWICLEWFCQLIYNNRNTYIYVYIYTYFMYLHIHVFCISAVLLRGQL